MVHGLLQLAKPKPTAAVVSEQAQHDGVLVRSVYVPGGQGEQLPSALPKLPAPHVEGEGMLKLKSTPTRPSEMAVEGTFPTLGPPPITAHPRATVQCAFSLLQKLLLLSAVKVCGPGAKHAGLLPDCVAPPSSCQ